MRNGYIAEDGTFFDNLANCVRYERTMGISEYDKIFGKSIKKTAKDVISFFHSSEALLRKGEDPEHNDIIRRARVHDSLCDGVGLVVGKGDIFFLRDDGVKAICDYVEKLEKELEETKRKLSLEKN
mgnify:FL=1